MPNASRSVILISGHYLGSKRRAGFHHLAEAYWRLGWDVTFVTAPISSLSWLRGDYRFEYPVRAEANKLVPVRERLASFVLMTWMHPVRPRSRLANRLAEPLLGATHGLRSIARRAARRRRPRHLRGNASLLLVERVRRMAPRARFVYRASDDLRGLGVHPLILEAEERALPPSILVSVPDGVCRRSPRPVWPGRCPPPARHRQGGLRSSHSVAVPQRAGGRIRRRVAFFDYDSSRTGGERRPGRRLPRDRASPRGARAGERAFHAEMPFESVVPYLQHAAFGFSSFPRTARSRSGTGNKVAQYSYCRSRSSRRRTRGRAGGRMRLRARGPGSLRARPRSGLADGALADICRGVHPPTSSRRSLPGTLVMEQKSSEPSQRPRSNGRRCGRGAPRTRAPG